MERVCIVGSGNWGSTIAKIVGRNAAAGDWVHPEVRMWVHEETVGGRKLTDVINQDHENPRYLPGIKLPENVRAVPDLAQACDDASLLIFVLPHQFLRTACKAILAAGRVRAGARAISLIKGLDANDSGIELASEVIREMLGMDVSVMMGANLANEVAQEQFCESTIGTSDARVGNTFKQLMQAPYFRLTVVTDVLGVELCGGLKNIIALGAGFVDGLRLGDNTKAAVIRIGLDEMRRFSRLFAGTRAQVQDETFFESCGVADLITSCFGGRNRRVAESHVTTGKSIEQLEAELLGGQKVQGPPAAKEAYKYLSSHRLCGQFPLLTAIYQVCYEAYPAQHVVESLIKAPSSPSSKI